MATEAQRKAIASYQKRRDNIMIRPDKDEGARIRNAAALADQSVQAYILDTLRARMEQDGIPIDTTGE